MKDRQRIEDRNARWFPHYRQAHLVYLQQASGLLPRSGVALHLGSGRDSVHVVRMLAHQCRMVVSLDPDHAGLRHNPNPARVQSTGEDLPFHDASFDMILAENVFEHLARPDLVLRECHRCLKERGTLVFLCPNKWSYVSLISALLPYWVHRRFRSFADGSTELDVFPTYYRLNSVGQIKSLGRQQGFALEECQSHVGHPSYWEFSDTLHRIFVVVHRGLEYLPAWTHITLTGVLRKQGERSPDARSEGRPGRVSGMKRVQ